MLVVDQPADAPLTFTPLTLTLTPPTMVGAEGTIDVTLTVSLQDYPNDIAPLVVAFQIVVAPCVLNTLPTLDIPFSYASQIYTVDVDTVLEVVAPTFTSAS